MATSWPADGTVAPPPGLPAAGSVPPDLVARTRDAVFLGTAVRGACGDFFLTCVVTAEATAAGTADADTVEVAPGTALEAPGTVPAHAVTAAMARPPPIPASPRRTPPGLRTDLMAHDARPAGTMCGYFTPFT